VAFFPAVTVPVGAYATAQERDALLVAKDEDVHRFSVTYGAPPKVVWVRLGNCTTDDLAGLLRRHRAYIERFVQQTHATFLELG
jgi:predicted nuclease of predicted toxin-antitoxin system